MNIKFSVVMIVNERSEILIVRRGETAPFMPLKWSMPGGTIEKGESPLEAACREIYEEVDIIVDPNKLEELCDEGDAKYYLCPPGAWRGTPKLKLTDGILENDMMTWEVADDALTFDLIPWHSKVIYKNKALFESNKTVSRLRNVIRKEVRSLL